MRVYRNIWAVTASAAILAACSQPASEEGDAVSTETPGASTGRQIVEIDPNNDPRVWLEEVEGEQALEWVEGQNDRTFARLQGDERYQGLYSGGYVWNFWQDAEYTHGLWRRTSLESYLSDTPEWDVVLDLDALSESEDMNWVWRGSNCLAPDYDRCILTLSDGGSDAAVRREFSISDRAFVEGGFETPEAKGGVSWIDENTPSTIRLGGIFPQTRRRCSFRCRPSPRFRIFTRVSSSSRSKRHGPLSRAARPSRRARCSPSPWPISRPPESCPR